MSLIKSSVCIEGPYNKRMHTDVPPLLLTYGTANYAARRYVSEVAAWHAGDARGVMWREALPNVTAANLKVLQT